MRVNSKLPLSRRGLKHIALHALQHSKGRSPHGPHDLPVYGSLHQICADEFGLCQHGVDGFFF